MGPLDFIALTDFRLVNQTGEQEQPFPVHDLDVPAFWADLRRALVARRSFNLMETNGEYR